MSGSLTVIGGHSQSQGLTGVVTVASGFTGTILTTLQTMLTADSGAVSTNSANFENLNVAGLFGAQAVTVGGFATGVLDISNTTSVGATTAGSTSVSVIVPAGYNTLVVEAPGHVAIAGNGQDNFLAIFGAGSDVAFYSNGGSGMVFAAGNDLAALSGTNDTFVGGAGGENTVTAAATNLVVTLAGAGNIVATSSANASILAAGSSDFIVAAGTNNNNITVTGSATVQNLGSADTVIASGNGAFAGFFGGNGGGIFNFINNSSAASSIIAGLNAATGTISSPGSVTVSAGAGGGVYDGGDAGNNSLVGGSGPVTLFGAGETNYLFTNGAVTGGGYNLLNSYSGSNDTLIAGSGSTSNVFFGGQGTELLKSSGSGAQTFFVGTLGSESLFGSTVSGATNTFIFNQTSVQGGGTDMISNFKLGEGFINPNNGVTGVTILSFESLSGVHTGTEIDLSNGTTIKLLGVSATSFGTSIVGGTKF